MCPQEGRDIYNFGLIVMVMLSWNGKCLCWVLEVIYISCAWRFPSLPLLKRFSFLCVEGKMVFWPQINLKTPTPSLPLALTLEHTHTHLNCCSLFPSLMHHHLLLRLSSFLVRPSPLWTSLTPEHPWAKVRMKILLSFSFVFWTCKTLC